ALALAGRLAEATSLVGRMWQSWQRAGRPPASPLSRGFAATAMAHCLLGDVQAFRLWRARADEAAAAVVGDPSRHLTFMYFVDARCAVHIGATASAGEIVAPAFSDRARGWNIGYARAAAAELAVVAGLPDAARLLAVAAPDAEENAWAAACLDRA